MVNAAKTTKSAEDGPPSSFAMHLDPPSAPTSPTTIPSSSARPRTVSSPAPIKTSDGNAIITDERQAAVPIYSPHDHSQKSKLTETSRTRRSTAAPSGVHFSISKTFSISSPLGFFARRRKSVQTSPARPSVSLEEVLEIGPEPGHREENDTNAIDEDEERERLRDAAAQALGLGLGRDSSGTPEPGPQDVESPQNAPMSAPSDNPYVLDPIPPMPPLTALALSPPSLVSLPHSQTPLAHSIVTTEYAVPPYPSSLSSLRPYIQTSSSLFKYHPSSNFLVLTLNRRAKQWKFHYVILTSPPPNTHDFFTNSGGDYPPRLNAEMYTDVQQIPNGDLAPLPSTRHSHLHLFKSASPSPEEMEMDRLEINEDSVVFTAEVDVAGKRDVVKVGGRDARKTVVGSGGASFKSTGSSWHGSLKADSEANVEEMGRTMWLLKMADDPERQRWIGHIRSAIFTQRAERAGMTFQQPPQGTVPNIRADLDVLLSLRSQAFLPSIAVSSDTITSPFVGYAALSTDSTSQDHAKRPRQASSSQSSTQKPPSSFSHTSRTDATIPTPVPTPNPRYAEHVGAAPSHATPPIRSRTYTSPSTLNQTLPSLKNLFSPPSTPSTSGFGHGVGSPPSKRASSSWQGSRPSSPQHDEKDIDPISDDIVSLGNRATSLLNMFRSSSRASNNHNQRASMGYNPATVTPASTTRSHGIGTPISTLPYSDQTVRAKPSGVGGQPAASSADWSMVDNGVHESATNDLGKQTPSLPPPPRNSRRPVANGTTRGNITGTRDDRDEVSLWVNGTAHYDDDSPLFEQRSTSAHGPRTPSPAAMTPPTSAPALPSMVGNRGFHGGRPPSANSMSSYASAEGDRWPEAERGNSIRRSRIVPKMLAPPTGPPPSAPSLRARSPSGTPSPVFEQDFLQRNGSSRRDTSSGTTSAWGSQHPYSNRVSGSSAMSIRTNSTGHSFLGSKVPPPPRPPPNFSPPPAPTDTQDGGMPTNTGRESFISRSHRLSLVPPAAPPTQSLPPRPDEPGYRHRRSHSNEVKSTSVLYPIPASPSHASVISHPPAPPPSGPLPPTPDSDRDCPSSRNSRRTSLTQRLRILSSPSPTPTTPNSVKEPIVVTSRRLIGEPILSQSDGYPAMFLHMSDTPISPAIPPFLPAPSPLQLEQDDDVEPTPLSPPPRRNSRNSREIRVSSHDKEDAKLLASHGTSLGPRDSAVVLGH